MIMPLVLDPTPAKVVLPVSYVFTPKSLIPVGLKGRAVFEKPEPEFQEVSCNNLTPVEITVPAVQECL